MLGSKDLAGLAAGVLDQFDIRQPLLLFGDAACMGRRLRRELFGENPAGNKLMPPYICALHSFVDICFSNANHRRMAQKVAEIALTFHFCKRAINEHLIHLNDYHSLL